MDLLSGDHVGLTKPFGFTGSAGCAVNCVFLLPSGRMSQISGNPVVLEGAANAIFVPSGDHDGMAPLFAMEVKWVPSAFITKIAFVGGGGVLRGMVAFCKASAFPAGDQEGTP